MKEAKSKIQAVKKPKAAKAAAKAGQTGQNRRRPVSDPDPGLKTFI